MAEVKSCIECKRPMAVTFDACPFCQAVQPQRSTERAREIKCEKCSRKYSAKLAACPFCANEGTKPQAGPPFRGPTAGDAPERASPPALEGDERANAEAKELGIWLKIGALGVIVLLTALWSFFSTVGGDRLAEGDTGLFGPCLFAGVVLGAGSGFLFHRWSDGQALPISGIVAAAMIIPWAGTSYGMAKWFNAVSIEDREQPVDCVLTSKHQRRGKHGGSWWEYGYKCTVEGGTELNGKAHSFTEPISAETGDTIRMTAARGRLGIWLRLSDPVTPPRR